ncbi:MAG TPA: PrsW family intramembrane metalloprotease [Herpetosiphonaceae bacterium]
MQCTQCGATVVASARFCPICGQALTTARPTPVAIDPGRLSSGMPVTPSIHDAPTVIMARPATATPTAAPSRSAAEVAALVANMGKSMVVSQWQRWWWKILLIGIALYLALNSVVVRTQNAILLPQLLMIGTFLVPVVYIAYLYEDGTLYDVPLSKIALLFFFGGVVGSMMASLLEAYLITSAATGLFGQLSLFNAAIVSVSEELAKLSILLPFLVSARQRYPTVMHGIVLGAATGMGFAAFESMGYAFSALIGDGGLETMHDVIRLRALLAPLGHGTWTAIIAAALWREHVNGYRPLNTNVLIALACSIVLHLLWDYLPPLIVLNLPVLHLMLGAIGILLLRFFLMDAKGEQGAAYAERNLAVALRLYVGNLRGELRDTFRHKQRS